MGRAGRLRMPDLPPGARRRLKQRLHELHLKAGAPSTGAMVQEMPSVERLSRSVVHGVFASPAVQQRDQVAAVTAVLARRIRHADAEELLDEVYRLWERAWCEETGAAGESASAALDRHPAARPPCREPNARLADLFARTGWTKSELARLVNRQAAVMGHPGLATDTSRVRRWLDMGASPRDPVPRVLAVLFTERLGRVVTIEDLGFEAPGSGGYGPYGVLPWSSERTAAVITEFTSMDLMLNRSELVAAGSVLCAGPPAAGPLPEPPSEPRESLPEPRRPGETGERCVVCGEVPVGSGGLLRIPASRAGVCRHCARDLGRLAD